MSLGFGFALPAYPLRGGGGNNPFNQLGPTLDLSFTGVVTDLTDPNGYTLNTDFIIPQYQIAAQYVVWETGVGLVNKTFSQIITFTRASTGTYFDSTGTLTTAAIDAPRLDYNPSTLAAQGLLIEDARTNLLLRSEDFATTWSALNVTPSTDTSLSPAGTLTADTLTPAASTAAHLISQSATVTASTAYSASVFVKTDGAPFVQIAYDNGASVGAFINVNLSTGAITRGPELSGGATNVTGSVVAVANGYYRISVGATHTGTTGRVLISPLPAGQSAAGLNPSITTAATDKIIVWGAQLEAGAFPTSYIPTTVAQVTRNADQASVNTLSPWYNSAASTLYTEFNTPVPTTVSNSAVVAGYDDGTANNRFSNFYVSNTGAVSANQTTAGTPNYTITGASGLTLSSVQKQATRFQAGSYASSVNGAAAVTDSFASAPPTVNTLRFGLRPSGTQANMWLRRVTVYPRGLTNAELQAITV